MVRVKSINLNSASSSGLNAVLIATSDMTLVKILLDALLKAMLKRIEFQHLAETINLGFL